MECESWLLSPALADLLPENSNIRRFQRAFALVSHDPEPNDVLEWVFRLTESQQETTAWEDLPEETGLQRSMKAFLLSGGRVGTAKGRLSWPFRKENC